MVLGVRQRAALNPSRRGLLGQLVVHVLALGVEPITGEPSKPTTQGKNERPHQGLPGRVTPLAAWEATEKAEAPRPTREQLARPRLHRPRPVPVSEDLPDDTVVKTLTSAGTFMLDKVHYKVDGRRGFQQVIADGDTITVTDPEGKILIKHTRQS